ncbi:DUF3861 family protein [Stenotrophomonas pavanii]|uniref:DUF3861 family protein n=1 Tax=Stenotrophomonas pavanii TaxID=487698 RepID=UPI0028940EEB|nr:DUF3861 family protein [Stenotrophomonas pavanii]MDT3456761.1 DUF3861 family protein [Stenotrophomonas pavanii]MDT3464646.1 DUF3861 family protein [Stenotrophomonas pavanii]MEC4340914.1 DUF3861 family protein [Stenotrophomonas pavanii]
MASPSTRYRISVTPIEKDGLQCTGRCTIELEHRASRDLMRLLEAAPRTAGISGDERATLVIATQLLRDIVQRHAGTDGHALAAIAARVLPALDALEQLPSSR